MSMQIRFDFFNDPRLQSDPNFLKSLRFRQQMAHKVARSDGHVTEGTEWRFDGPDCAPDVDPRRRDQNGAPLILPSWSIYLSYGLKNLVVEKKGKPDNLVFRNASLRNTIRIKTQVLEDTGKKDKHGAPIKHWVDQNQPIYLPANQWGGVNVGDGMRSIVDEMPT